MTEPNHNQPAQTGILTPEQSAIINTSSNCTINAVPASGKTTIIIAYTEARSAQEKILYLIQLWKIRSSAGQFIAMQWQDYRSVNPFAPLEI